MVQYQVFCVVLFLLYCIDGSDFQWREIAQLITDLEIYKFSLDFRQYRALVLKNGLKIFLISQPDFDSPSVDLKILSFANWLTNQSLCSFIQFGSFHVYGEIYGFNCGLTELCMKNYDLILNYTFLHVKAVKKLLDKQYQV